MTTFNVTLWKNIQPDPYRETASKGMADGYDDGDALCNVWEGTVDSSEVRDHVWGIGDAPTGEAALQLVAEVVFSIHNRDDRPTGQLCPSASIGDVVQVGDRFFAVASVGFKEVPVPDGGPAHLPRRKLGAGFFARTHDEYLAAENQARKLARDLAARRQAANG